MQTDKIHIKEVGLNDLELLRNISIQTFTETFSEHNTESNMRNYIAENLSRQKLQKEIKNIDSSFYFAVFAKQIIGYLKINTGKAQTENHTENSFEIERIYVLREFHGKHIGKFLFEKARTLALEKKCDYIWLGVWEKNSKSIAFYRKLGFVIYDQHVFILGNDKQTDFMMKLVFKY